LADFSSAGWETPKVGFVRVRLAGNCQRLALVSVGLHLKSPTGAGWPCPWQAVSVAKLTGLALAAELAGESGTVAGRRVSLGPKPGCESLSFG